MLRYLALAFVCLAASVAQAGKVDVVFDPPAEPDLKSCMIFLRVDGVTGALDAKTVLAADLNAGEAVQLLFNTIPLQGRTGHVDGICEDLGGQVTEVPASRAVTFPDVRPELPFSETCALRLDGIGIEFPCRKTEQTP